MRLAPAIEKKMANEQWTEPKLKTHGNGVQAANLFLDNLVRPRTLCLRAKVHNEFAKKKDDKKKKKKKDKKDNKSNKSKKSK